MNIKEVKVGSIVVRTDSHPKKWLKKGGVYVVSKVNATTINLKDQKDPTRSFAVDKFRFATTAEVAKFKGQKAKTEKLPEAKIVVKKGSIHDAKKGDYVIRTGIDNNDVKKGRIYRLEKNVTFNTAWINGAMYSSAFFRLATQEEVNKHLGKKPVVTSKDALKEATKPSPKVVKTDKTPKWLKKVEIKTVATEFVQTDLTAGIKLIPYNGQHPENKKRLIKLGIGNVFSSPINKAALANLLLELGEIYKEMEA